MSLIEAEQQFYYPTVSTSKILMAAGADPQAPSKCIYGRNVESLKVFLKSCPLTMKLR